MSHRLMIRSRQAFVAALMSTGLASGVHATIAREVELVQEPTGDIYFMGTLVAPELPDVTEKNRSVVFSRERAVFPTGNKKKPTCAGDFKVVEQGSGKAMYMVLDPTTHSLSEGARGYPFQYRVIKFQKSACASNQQTWLMKVRMDNPRIIETKIYNGTYGPNEPFRETAFTKIE